MTIPPPLGHPPRLAILSLLDWPNACRWPGPLAAAGFQVESIGREHDLVHASSRVARRRVIPLEALAGRQALQSFLLGEWRHDLPDLILAADEAAVQELDLLYRNAATGEDTRDLAHLLVRSKGDPGHFRTLQSKHATQDLARRLGLRIPDQRICTGIGEALSWALALGYPVVVKQEFNWAGLGVRICADPGQLRAAWNALGDRGPLAVQRHIPGRSAMSDAACAEGRLLIANSYLKLQIWPEGTGPSCVVRAIHHPEMLEATRRFVAATGYSGILSLDFQVDAANQAHLLECNPRPIPTSHLDPRLFRALRTLVPGGPEFHPGEPPPLRDIILFPKELRRNAHSPHFATAHHDVPWEEPDLIPRLMAHR